MKPRKVDLPTIWRGCDWGPVILKWKDKNGNPIDVSFFTPKAQSRNINLHASKTDPVHGVTQLLMGKDLTINLKLGVEEWDWLWERITGSPPVTTYRFPPFLYGKVEVKDPKSAVGGDTPPIPAPPDNTEPPTFSDPPPST